MTRKILLASCTLALAMMVLPGCSAIVAVTDAAVTVGATAVKITAKAVGAVADAVIPDSNDKKKENK